MSDRAGEASKDDSSNKVSKVSVRHAMWGLQCLSAQPTSGLFMLLKMSLGKGKGEGGERDICQGSRGVNMLPLINFFNELLVHGIVSYWKTFPVGRAS